MKKGGGAVKKKVWVSMLEKNEGLGRILFEELARYGLEPGGHFWEDDPSGLGWAGPSTEINSGSCAAWLIVGQAESFGKKETRQGLALAALAAQGAHGHGFPILISPSGGPLDPGSLPTPLLGAEMVNTSLGVKTVARVNAGKPGGGSADYRLDVRPLPGLGLWFEIGTSRDPWQGAFFGCSGEGEASPDAHGVGPAGTIPQKSTLHYPVRGMKLEMKGREFSAWGVRNELSPADSYYVRVNGVPEALVFGPFPDDDDAEVLTVSLV